MIFNNLVEIAAGGISEAKSKAASFLYILVHSSEIDSEYKGKLESEANLITLFQNENYKSQAIEVLSSEDPIDFDELNVVAGFPLAFTIQPGEQKFFIVEVKEANSILT